jgi:ribonuclease D
MMEQHVEVTRGDLDLDFYWAAMGAASVAWDIETSGLDWAADRIGTCQVATEHGINIVILGDGNQAPKRLATLLESPDTRKVFHHAPFDLRFMTHQWAANASNVACTKVASKILNPELENGGHSLLPVLRRHLGVAISKDEQRSNWLDPDLTSDQVRYAADDVGHLLTLVDVLEQNCRRRGLHDLLSASWRYLPVRVQLDLHGSGDVFAY